MTWKGKSGIIGLMICLTCLLNLRAQEVLVPAGRPVFPDRSVSTDRGTRKSAAAGDFPDTLELPFFDDFSRRGQFPHPEFWIDEYAYINNTYTRNPVTIGVATLDAIDSGGELNGSSKLPFESDFLTSAPINLDYPGREDIWLSFFYEPKGLGDEPEEWDSLTVQFFFPDSSSWETVWRSVGSPADTFQQVFIPVRDPRFLKKDFRFRFKNYASLPRVPGYDDMNNNADHWNIDYVYLDTARSSNVTAVNDVSMITSLGSLLKTYQSIPWKHFPKAYVTELRSNIDISYRNNDTTTRNVTRILKITNLKDLKTDSVNGGTVNALPGRLNTFSFPCKYPFIFYEADSTVFEIQSYLLTDEQDYKWNDTVVRYQRFYNYYAYDDGSAENGYGLRGEGTANASIAYRFESFKPDTLRGVNMYFNRTLGDYSQNYFYLAVWDHDRVSNGPGELLYRMSGVRPEYPEGLNRFYTYTLDTILVVRDFFYVGWIKTTETMLNVGWDVGNNHRDKIFYNLGQGWVNTGFNGSLMVRPLMGGELSFPVAEKEIPELRLEVYPNPASEVFHLELHGGSGTSGYGMSGYGSSGSRQSGYGSYDFGSSSGESAGQWTVSLYDLQGRRVYSRVLGSGGSQTGAYTGDETSHYIGDLPEGMYIIRLDRGGLYRAGVKLMIVR